MQDELETAKEKATGVVHQLVAEEGMALCQALVFIATETNRQTRLTLTAQPESDNVDVRMEWPQAETVTITKEEHERLLDALKWRQCLKSGGVDNWEWYSESLREGGYWEEVNK